MTQTIRQLLSIVVLTAVAAGAQTGPTGEIAGRMSDTTGAALPGARIRIRTGDESRDAITGADGRFVVGFLPLATHQVSAELAGFVSKSGAITLSPDTRRAYLAWRLEVGCLDEGVRVILNARQAAPVVDAVVHVRISSADGSVLVSQRPDCAGRVLQQYSVVVLENAKAGAGMPSGRTDQQIFLSPNEAGLQPGGEYLALLWPGGLAADRLVLPIRSGRVVSQAAGELAGVSVREALRALRNWSRRRG